MGAPGRNFSWRCFWVSEVEGSGTGFGCVRTTDRGQLLRRFPRVSKGRNEPGPLGSGGGRWGEVLEDEAEVQGWAPGGIV